MTSRYVGIAYCKNPICIPKSQEFYLFRPNGRTLKSVRHEEQVIWCSKWEKICRNDTHCSGSGCNSHCLMSDKLGIC